MVLWPSGSTERFSHTTTRGRQFDTRGKRGGTELAKKSLRGFLARWPFGVSPVTIKSSTYTVLRTSGGLAAVLNVSHTRLPEVASSILGDSGLKNPCVRWATASTERGIRFLARWPFGVSPVTIKSSTYTPPTKDSNFLKICFSGGWPRASVRRGLLSFLFFFHSSAFFSACSVLAEKTRGHGFEADFPAVVAADLSGVCAWRPWRLSSGLTAPLGLIFVLVQDEMVMFAIPSALSRTALTSSQMQWIRFAVASVSDACGFSFAGAARTEVLGLGYPSMSSPWRRLVVVLQQRWISEIYFWCLLSGFTQICRFRCGSSVSCVVCVLLAWFHSGSSSALICSVEALVVTRRRFGFGDIVASVGDDSRGYFSLRMWSEAASLTARKSSRAARCNLLFELALPAFEVLRAALNGDARGNDDEDSRS
ncbi:LOW QUALITY PROTEIN: hypothetical protein HID58_060092 [Brassica napus]|uniref:Uncharacterized protein n=1 Tax=Brassica napus TaxID=3708 RepID=A0ABQ7ZUQ1_BRANA|nr:LOW QUALITY PROTEIN: hypothetical protein HID58_060092 [Brassica napus]